MPITLRLRENVAIPMEMGGVDLDALTGLTAEGVAKQTALVGARQTPLGELFTIRGTPDGDWRFEGDLSRVDGLATGLANGRVVVDGSIGLRAGEGLRGGGLTILGSAGGRLGGAMRAGSIEVRGDAGDGVGAPRPGCQRGMTGGTIVVRGGAAAGAATAMRRGCIVIGGDCGPLAGYKMLAGSLVVLGRCGDYPGAEMRRGTIALLGGAPTPLPTFAHACRSLPQALRLMSRSLAEAGVQIPTAEVDHWNGDLLAGGRGELWVA